MQMLYFQVYFVRYLIFFTRANGATFYPLVPDPYEADHGSGSALQLMRIRIISIVI